MRPQDFARTWQRGGQKKEQSDFALAGLLMELPLEWRVEGFGKLGFFLAKLPRINALPIALRLGVEIDHTHAISLCERTTGRHRYAARRGDWD
jgi:hypothetical protein